MLLRLLFVAGLPNRYCISAKILSYTHHKFHSIIGRCKGNHFPPTKQESLAFSCKGSRAEGNKEGDGPDHEAVGKGEDKVGGADGEEIGDKEFLDKDYSHSGKGEAQKAEIPFARDRETDITVLYEPAGEDAESEAGGIVAVGNHFLGLDDKLPVGIVVHRIRFERDIEEIGNENGDTAEQDPDIFVRVLLQPTEERRESPEHEDALDDCHSDIVGSMHTEVVARETDDQYRQDTQQPYPPAAQPQSERAEEGSGVLGMPRGERVACGGLDRVAIRHNSGIAYPRTVDTAGILEQLVDNAGTPHSRHHKIALPFVDTEIDESDDENRQYADNKVGGSKEEGREQVIGCLAEVLEEEEVVHY